MLNKKFCIFCGEKPESKNKEHVIPKWLIELTGDPKRKAFFGFDVVSENKGPRMYSFDSFTFPACEQCNTDFAELECHTKPIAIKILQNKKVTSQEINTFLDWIDKVRVGLWLGYYYLDKNMAEITPKFHIKTRIGSRDRLLIVYKTNYYSKGINFTGTEGISFQFSPSCFSLRINHLVFFNASCMDLCDRRLGFPFSRKTIIYNRKQAQADIVHGFERIFKPVLKRTFLPYGIKIFQPIFKKQMSFDGIGQYYDNKYVRNNSMDYSKGLGKIFIDNTGSARALSDEEEISIVPDGHHDYLKFLPKLSRMTFDFQIDLFRMSTTENLSKEEKKEFKMHLILMRKSRDVFCKIIEDRVEKQTQQG